MEIKKIDKRLQAFRLKQDATYETLRANLSKLQYIAAADESKMLVYNMQKDYANVEHAFGDVKQIYGFARKRYNTLLKKINDTGILGENKK